MKLHPLAAGLLSLGLCELLLRCAGVGPWHRFADLDALPRMSDPHPELGWTSRPGVYHYRSGQREITVSIGTDGARGPIQSGRPVHLFGGSFLFGFGLSDEETLSSALHALRPDLSIRNHAVPGYSTLQSWMDYRSIEPVQTAVYGLIDLHDSRNPPTTAWLHALERSTREPTWTSVPGARWDGTTLHTSPPRRYHHWDWSERSALIDLFERSTISLRDRLQRTKSETTIQLVLRFRDQVEATGGRFIVALLHAPSRSRYYTRRLSEEQVEWLDLRSPNFPGFQTADGHPDARVHAGWAQHLSAVL